VSERDNPRTARLLASGRSKIAQKLIEEAGEIALEAVRRRSRNVVRESADLVYHLVVLWHECGITPDEVWAEMRSRADKLGIAEKLPKSPGRHAAPTGFGK
jgi:phosphoribosyl-ATP pyrophosphohydrolase